jgi:type I restriction enzyme S subunit
MSEWFIPLPPLVEQHRIVTAIESAFALIDEIERGKADLQAAVTAAKSRILSLAISGKLVPQDPDDEPAAALLERIRAEKKSLAKSGKIKSAKGDGGGTAICDNSYYGKLPFDVPESWVWSTIDDISVYVQRGKSPVYSPQRKYPILAQKCNQWRGITLDNALFFDPITFSQYGEERFLKTGDVVINSTGNGTLGRVGIFDESILGDYECLVADSHVSIVRSSSFIDSRYVYLFLCSPYQQKVISDNATGSTKQIELYIDVIKNFLIPIPPLKEQQKIVRAVDSAFAFLEHIAESII